MSPSLAARLGRFIDARSDDVVLRWLFGAMLAVTATVLVLDYTELQARITEEHAAPTIVEPTLPSEPGSGRPDEKPAQVRADEKLPARMSFDLTADGRLLAVGTIQPGTADSFAGRDRQARRLPGKPWCCTHPVARSGTPWRWDA